MPIIPEGDASFSLGRFLDSDRQFTITERDMATHMAVFGRTGSGKSKFLELLLCLLMAVYRGFCLIDPHGDLSEDVLARACTRHRAIRRRLHYLEPSFDWVFGYDPFRFQPGKAVPETFREAAYLAWLSAKVDRVAEILIRKQGEANFEGKPRLQRVLRDVLYAVGVSVNAEGTHLPLADSLVLLDFQHPRHSEILETVAPHLPRDVLADFEILASARNEEERLRQTESTLNRLRSMLSPIVRAIFARQVLATLDFRSIVRQHGILLVNLRETDYFSADQANAIGGLVIHEILSVARTAPREERRQFYLFIDEAARFIGDDLQRALAEARKFKLSICLCFQDVSSLRKEE
jgi:DNA helicase HerA-like ATPase